MTSVRGNAEIFMRAALRGRAISLGQTSPNPAVGAVLVIDSERVLRRAITEARDRPMPKSDTFASFPKPVAKRAILYGSPQNLFDHRANRAFFPATRLSGAECPPVGDWRKRPNPKAPSDVESTCSGKRASTCVLEFLKKECFALNEAAYNKWIRTRASVRHYEMRDESRWAIVAAA